MTVLSRWPAEWMSNAAVSLVVAVLFVVVVVVAKNDFRNTYRLNESIFPVRAHHIAYFEQLAVHFVSESMRLIVCQESTNRMMQRRRWWWWRF